MCVHGGHIITSRHEWEWYVESHRLFCITIQDIYARK